MSTEYRFIRPLDVLILRGNKLFGDAGSYGESQMPPWPSVAAGAIRSRILADEGVDLERFKKSELTHPSLGTPKEPGPFLLENVFVAAKKADKTEIVMPLPADVVVTKNDDGKVEVNLLEPQALHLVSSNTLPLTPVLAQGSDRTKPVSCYWLNQTGWQCYIQGQALNNDHLVELKDLWRVDERVGIGMDSVTRSVEEGKLFTTQAIAMNENMGFLAAVSGANPPNEGLLRFGGDGRAAQISACEITLPEADLPTILRTKRCKLILSSPGVFAQGWHPFIEQNDRVELPGFSAKLMSAAVNRSDVISGWDLAAHKPKPAQKVASTGSVYWLDDIQTSEEAMRKLANSGLWHEAWHDKQRQAEGFNRFAWAIWDKN
jgi:CRISPR-associated protein Cmr3